MTTRLHTTVSGRRIEYTPSPKVSAFLDRLTKLVDDPKATENDLVALAYGKTNPILDPTIFPERGAVTKEVLDDPAYAVMQDLLFRKSVVERKIDIAKVAARYSMTPADAAEELGVHETAIRKAIAAKRIASWMRDGRHYLDPNAVRAMKLTANAGRKKP